MAYKVIILYQLDMPSYFLGTFTEYPFFIPGKSFGKERFVFFLIAISFIKSPLQHFLQLQGRPVGSSTKGEFCREL